MMVAYFLTPIYSSSEKRQLICDHIKGPLVAAFRSPMMMAPDRSVETLGLWIVTYSVTFIKSVNQSNIKPCLIVHLVAMCTLIYFDSLFAIRQHPTTMYFKPQEFPLIYLPSIMHTFNSFVFFMNGMLVVLIIPKKKNKVPQNTISSPFTCDRNVMNATVEQMAVVSCYSWLGVNIWRLLFQR